MSGTAGHGGMELFNTYLLILGCLHSGAGLPAEGLGAGQPHGDASPQLPHELELFSNPSCFMILENNRPITRPITNIPNK
jgi:hypothetical protein